MIFSCWIIGTWWKSYFTISSNWKKKQLCNKKRKKCCTTCSWAFSKNAFKSTRWKYYMDAMLKRRSQREGFSAGWPISFKIQAKMQGAQEDFPKTLILINSTRHLRWCACNHWRRRKSFLKLRFPSIKIWCSKSTRIKIQIYWRLNNLRSWHSSRSYK